MEIVYELLSAINGIKVSASTKDISETKTMNLIIDSESNMVIGAIVQYLEPKSVDDEITKEYINFNVK